MRYIYLTILVTFAAACTQTNQSDLEESTSTPSIFEEESDLWLTYSGDPDKPKIVLIAGDEEYRSEEALPALADILNTHHGFNCRVVFSQDPEKPGVANPNYSFNIPGLEALEEADLVILFTRFRALKDDQMKMIDNYLMKGKPIIAIRTATHAFHFKEEVETSYRHYGNYYQSDDEWNGGFGRLVLGEKWIRHHGNHGNQSTRGMFAPGAESHPVLTGIEDGQIWGPTDVYGIRLPMQEQTQALVLGKTVNRVGEKDESDPLLGMRSTDDLEPESVIIKNDQGEEVQVDLNEPMMPIVWTKDYQLPKGQPGKSLTTTIGSSTDMLNEGVRKLLVNATYWMSGLEVPESANVSFTREYNPSRFAFQDDAYWSQKNLVIKNLR